MADLRPQYNEEAVGANHPTKTDVINRAYNVEHEEDGIHTYIFTDRGDPAAFDFAVGDFTTDGTWRDLDLSSIIPAGTKAILLIIALKDDAVNSSMQFRENGNSNALNVTILSTQVANVEIYADLIVACDTNRIIEYNGSNLAFININVLVKGWWK